jgi:SAM-dependent methyltransferase
MRDTDRDWERVARTEPYWGVLSSEEFRGLDLSEDKRRQFFASGERYVGDLLGLIDRHFGAPHLGRALDFGCGVGRLSIPLAVRCEEVVAVDTAPTMLDLCRRNSEKVKLTNVKFALGDDELSAVPGLFDLVITYITLQHIPSQRGLAIIERLLAVLKPGAAFSLQLTYARARHFLLHEEPRAQFYRRSGEFMVDLLATKEQPPIGTITMHDYDLNEVFALISQFAGSPVLTLPTRDDDHLGIQFIGKRA